MAKFNNYFFVETFIAIFHRGAKQFCASGQIKTSQGGEPESAGIADEHVATTGAWSPQSDSHHRREVRDEIKQTSSKTVRENPPRFGDLRGGGWETLAPSLGENALCVMKRKMELIIYRWLGIGLFFFSLCFNNQLVPEARAVWPRCHRVQKWASVYFVDWISNVVRPRARTPGGKKLSGFGG